MPDDTEATANRNSRVTIILACYNHRPYVEQALQSIADQTVRPTQLIVTDDASQDGSPEVIEKWLAANWVDAIFLRNLRNLGLPKTLNAVIPEATGEFVALISADDWMRSDRVELQLRAFGSAQPGVGMVYSDMIEVNPDGEPTGQQWFDADRMGPAADGDLFQAMIRRANIAAPSVMIRTECLRKVGPYDETLVAEDYDMFLRLSRHYRWIYLPQGLIYYRVLPSSLSRSPAFKTTYRVGRIHLLRKHVGITSESDLVISDRIAKMAESLYKEGRSPRATAHDIWFSLEYRRTLRRYTILVFSVLRIPGPLLVSLASRVRA